MTVAPVPVLERYVGDVAVRVAGFGGDPGQILPSPTGDVPGLPFVPGGPPGHGRPAGDRLEVTGKINAKPGRADLRNAKSGRG